VEPDLADGTRIESSMDIVCLSPARGLGAVLPPGGGPGGKDSASPVDGDGLGGSRGLVKLSRLRSSPDPKEVAVATAPVPVPVSGLSRFC
jgi:hypothetical protein